ncbi:MAG TPA: hypothetical protein VLG44_07835 [Chlamydiales bacterium]|nr:hypothetical protein [Chlamydiales bacterium]
MEIQDSMVATLRGTIFAPLKTGTLWQGFGVTYKVKAGLELLYKIGQIAKELLGIVWDEMAKFFRLKKRSVTKNPKTKEVLKLFKLLYGKECLDE